VLGAALFAAGPVLADAPSCPKSIEVAETIGAIPQGFKAFANGNTPSADLTVKATRDLGNIQFSDGPPNETAWLAPDNEDRGFEMWHFEPSPGKQIWYTCGYSETRVILSAPLPAEIKSCRVKRDASIQGYPATGMTCK
jgi:hypothetical protein